MVLAGAAGAQASAQGVPPTPRLTREGITREVNERRRALLGKDAEIDRWLDLLIRHHLGLAIGEEQAFAPSENERAMERGDAESMLAEGQRQVASLDGELERLRGEIAARCGAAAAASPTATATAPPRTAATPLPEPQAPAPPSPSSSAPSPEPESPDANGGEADDPEAEAPARPELLSGTSDPALLGPALFRAGRYEQAKETLEKAAVPRDAPLLTLFYLARTYEKLGDLARADGLWLRIEEVDSERKPDGTVVPGRFANAAHGARQHMAWMRDHGQWAPARQGAAERQR